MGIAALKSSQRVPTRFQIVIGSLASGLFASLPEQCLKAGALKNSVGVFRCPGHGDQVDLTWSITRCNVKAAVEARLVRTNRWQGHDDIAREICMPRTPDVRHFRRRPGTDLIRR